LTVGSDKIEQFFEKLKYLGIIIQQLGYYFVYC